MNYYRITDFTMFGIVSACIILVECWICWKLKSGRGAGSIKARYAVTLTSEPDQEIQ